MTSPGPSEIPKPSGTVVVIREGGAQLELLLLERTPRDGEPGPWVFPGGKVDAADLRPGEDAVAAARRAAVREAQEEASIALALESLVPFSRWITPEISPKRFDTWFFLAPLRGTTEVCVDGSEIQAHRWVSPADALTLHHERSLRLAPPTFVTLSTLLGKRSVVDAVAAAREAAPLAYLPRVVRVAGGACSLYPADAGWELRDPTLAGPRNRLWMLESGWRYEREL